MTLGLVLELLALLPVHTPNLTPSSSALISSPRYPTHRYPSHCQPSLARHTSNASPTFAWGVKARCLLGRDASYDSRLACASLPDRANAEYLSISCLSPRLNAHLIKPARLTRNKRHGTHGTLERLANIPQLIAWLDLRSSTPVALRSIARALPRARLCDSAGWGAMIAAES